MRKICVLPPMTALAALRRTSAGALLALSTAAALRAQPPLAPGEVLVERTFLPNAHASSFAFGLPGGINVCYDPVRGGVNYVWTGGFLDLTGVRPANKLVTAAQPLGPIVYRETGPAPLRHGDPAHVPAIVFKGYTLRSASVELRYTVDGVLVREEISARRDTVVRDFKVPVADGEKWWFVVENVPLLPITVDASGAFSSLILLRKAAP